MTKAELKIIKRKIVCALQYYERVQQFGDSANPLGYKNAQSSLNLLNQMKDNININSYPEQYHVYLNHLSQDIPFLKTRFKSIALTNRNNSNSKKR